MNTVLARDGDLATFNEVLGWVINTHLGILALSSKQFLELVSPLEIPDSQRCMSVKNLDHLISNLHSMHLAVPGSIRHFYAMLVSLARARSSKREVADFSAQFQQASSSSVKYV